MTVEELLIKLQDLDVDKKADIIIWDDKDREYEITNVDSLYNSEITIDIKKVKYQRR